MGHSCSDSLVQDLWEIIELWVEYTGSFTFRLNQSRLGTQGRVSHLIPILDSLYFFDLNRSKIYRPPDQIQDNILSGLIIYLISEFVDLIIYSEGFAIKISGEYSKIDTNPKGQLNPNLLISPSSVLFRSKIYSISFTYGK